LHAPLASHVLAPVHESLSSAPFTAPHVPLPAAHVMQVPLHAPEQHTPSSQTPEEHSAPIVHG
jgi:hypothetical protein